MLSHCVMSASSIAAYPVEHLMESQYTGSKVVSFVDNREIAKVGKADGNNVVNSWRFLATEERGVWSHK